MSPNQITVDEDLHGLMMQSDKFTARELTDAYTQSRQKVCLNVPLTADQFRHHVSEHIMRMLEVGWVKRVRVYGGADQAFKLMAKPLNLEVTFISRDKPVRRRSPRRRKEANVPVSQEPVSRGPACARTEPKRYLGELHEEIRSDFLSAMGEAERYQQLIEVMPHLKGKLEGAYLDARDRRARLQGHLRAVQTTLSMLRA
ncbi:hypothetical protein ACFPTX_16090 [Pseudomonas sp. GCM10022188]|uniref:hypothetical protein n=1 Tax=Pseudomonas TaxID=286 RepID=UPI001E560C2E|nr:hypothetical protein [Pseudomonas oryzagri]MCC6076045.1 hypothetical protein [Pseudomonas oryzagri]